MRIIRILVVAVVLGVMLLPQITLAANTEDTNETNINTKIKENISQIKNILSGSPDFLLSGADNNTEDKIENPTEAVEEIIVKEEDLFSEKSFIANVSAYTAAADECGKSDGITASGERVKENHTLACPKNYAFGTKVKIEGYGVYTCKDRGGAIKGNKFDIYMQTKKEAFAFGRRHLRAEVIL